MSEPDYTHALHDQACQEAAQDRIVLEQHVLAKRGQIVYCAKIKAPYTVPGGPDCWTLETLFPEKTRITVPCRNVIACDSAFCSCLESVAVRVGLACDGTPAPAAGSPVLEVTCL